MIARLLILAELTSCTHTVAWPILTPGKLRIKREMLHSNASGKKIHAPNYSDRRRRSIICLPKVTFPGPKMSSVGKSFEVERNDEQQKHSNKALSCMEICSWENIH